jgi:hypothetical protein
LWAEWRTAIKDAFLTPSIIRANKARTALLLQQTLGPWIGIRHRRQRKWTHYVSDNHKVLYVTHPTGFHCQNRIPTLFRHRRFQVEKSSTIPILAPAVVATSVNCIPGRHSLNIPHIPHQETTPYETANYEAPTPTTLNQRIQQLAHWQTPLLQHLTHQQNKQHLHQLLSKETPTNFEIASDGGAREDLGSFEWNIALAQTTLGKCKGPTFGLLPGSFRAESYGMLSALLFLDTYFKHYDTKLNATTILKFYCDSSLLLKRVARAQNQSWLNPTTCLASDFDLESGIMELIKALPITIKFIHVVKSHQDKDT